MSAENPTASELLIAVNVAILALIQKPASTLTINGRTYTYQDIDKLRVIRSELQIETGTGTTSGMRLADISGADL